MDKNYKIIIQKLAKLGLEIEYLENWDGNFENLHRFALKQLRYDYMCYTPLLALSEIIKGCFNPNKYDDNFSINDEYKEKSLTSELQDTLSLLFGECYFFEQAGYLLPNGALLDFTEGGESRQDHRFITGLIEELVSGKFDTPLSGLIWMEENGALRIQKTGFEVATKLTSQQIKTIKTCREYLPEIYVDVVVDHNHNVNPASRTFYNYHYDDMNKIIDFINKSLES